MTDGSLRRRTALVTRRRQRGGAAGHVADLTVKSEVADLLAAAGNQTGLDEWRSGLDRNLTTAFLVTRAVLPGMLSRGRGRLANVASTTGPVNAMPDEAR